MRRAKALEKTLMLGTIKSKMGAGQQRMKYLNTVTNSIDVNLSKLGKTVKDRGAWCAAVHGVTKSRTQLSDRTITTQKQKCSTCQLLHSEDWRMDSVVREKNPSLSHSGKAAF